MIDKLLLWCKQSSILVHRIRIRPNFGIQIRIRPDFEIRIRIRPDFEIRIQIWPDFGNRIRIRPVFENRIRILPEFENRIRIRPKQPDPDPTKTTGSTTLRLTSLKKIYAWVVAWWAGPRGAPTPRWERSSPGRCSTSGSTRSTKENTLNGLKHGRKKGFFRRKNIRFVTTLDLIKCIKQIK